MSAREKILKSIQSNLARNVIKTPEENYAERKQAHLIPEFIQCDQNALVKLFIEKANAASTKVLRCQSSELALEIKKLVTADDKVRMAPELSNIKWQDLDAQFGTACESDTISITSAFFGIAETGTLLCLSSPTTPTLLNFLPEKCVMILHEKNIVASYEDAWQKVRDINKHDVLPRNINFITGPSRTGDIEQQLLLGIHGPRELYIILVNGESDE